MDYLCLGALGVLAVATGNHLLAAGFSDSAAN
jgi:hypothetical protein